MKLIARLVAALVGFILGAATTTFLVGRYMAATYACKPGASEPCDVHGFVGFGLVIVWAPAVGLVCAAFGYWLARRRQRLHAA